MKIANIPIFVPHWGCPQQCSFCNQRQISGVQQALTPEAAADFCRQALRSLPPGRQARIAFFGGSFTAIPRQEMIALLEAAQPFRTDPRVQGIRISTRPDAIDREILATLAHYGVDAIELGAQSMYNEVLEVNHRGHTREDVIRAAEEIHSAGMQLGLQMMTGLYGSSREMDLATGQMLAKLKPQEVRIYPTVVLAGTHLDSLLKAGEYAPPGLEETVDLCADLVTMFEQADITVLRIGLHASELVGQSATGGNYHPAMGELVYSRIYLRQMLAQLENIVTGKITLQIQTGLRSKIAGHHNRNLIRLQDMGYTVKIIESPHQTQPFIITQGDTT